MIPEDRLQQLIDSKDAAQARSWTRTHRYSEGWAIIDGCLVIYNIDDAPSWLSEQLGQRDETGNTPGFNVKGKQAVAD